MLSGHLKYLAERGRLPFPCSLYSFLCKEMLDFGVASVKPIETSEEICGNSEC